MKYLICVDKFHHPLVNEPFVPCPSCFNFVDCPPETSSSRWKVGPFDPTEKEKKFQGGYTLVS